MILESIISWISVGVILAGVMLILAQHDWRFQLAGLALQYLGAFWLITRHLPYVIGSAKLVAGWMVVATLGMTHLNLPATLEKTPDQRRWFSLGLAGIATALAFGAAPQIENAIPGLGIPVIAGSLILFGAGLLQIGITSDITAVIVGLLGILLGFEVLYSAVENSVLVAGLLSVINLGLGLTGSYLLSIQNPIDRPEEENILQ